MSEHEATEVETELGAEDFDAFWEAKAKSGERVGKTTRIMGETVTLPPALPLRFEMEAKRLQRSKNERDMKTLLGTIFDADAMDRWVAKGMDLEQFMVLIAWAPQVIAGADVTLAEVAESVRKELEGATRPR